MEQSFFNHRPVGDENSAISVNSGRLSRIVIDLKALLDQRQDRLKLILHVGTSKTGTTSLQSFFYENTSLIRKHGIVYPDNIGKAASKNHIWINYFLKRNMLDALFLSLKKSIEQLEYDSSTLILSAEGIYLHWWDNCNEAKCFLNALAQCLDLHIWVWFREPVSFMESFYVQTLKNPMHEDIPTYGQDLSLLECLDDKSFARHLDYLGFLQEIKSLHDDITIKTFVYKKNATVQQACAALRIKFDQVEHYIRHQSFGVTAVSEIRKINRTKLTNEEKRQAVQHIKKMHRTYWLKDGPFLATDEEKKKILEIFEFQRKPLKQHYNISFER